MQVEDVHVCSYRKEDVTTVSDVTRQVLHCILGGSTWILAVPRTAAIQGRLQHPCGVLWCLQYPSAPAVVRSSAGGRDQYRLSLMRF